VAKSGRRGGARGHETGHQVARARGTGTVDTVLHRDIRALCRLVGGFTKQCESSRHCLRHSSTYDTAQGKLVGGMQLFDVNLPSEIHESLRGFTVVIPSSQVLINLERVESVRSFPGRKFDLQPPTQLHDKNKSLLQRQLRRWVTNRTSLDDDGLVVSTAPGRYLQRYAALGRCTGRSSGAPRSRRRAHGRAEST